MEEQSNDFNIRTNSTCYFIFKWILVTPNLNKVFEALEILLYVKPYISSMSYAPFNESIMNNSTQLSKLTLKLLKQVAIRSKVEKILFYQGD